MLWVLRKFGSIHSSEPEDNSRRHGNLSRTWKMKRSRRHYIVITVLLTSIFWLAIELVLLAYSNNLNIDIHEQPFYEGKLRDISDYSQISVGKEQRKNEEESFVDHEQAQKKKIISINEFESSYVAILPIKLNGPGENGAKVSNDDSEEEAEKTGYKKYSFNELASSKISLERSIPDNRPPECFYQKYPQELPSASVIVIFHNEAWSTLLRTVHTVLARSPSFLLKEIILVDDCSNYEQYGHLEDKLQRYVASFKKVRLIRAEKRQGLIRARLIGAKHATGDVLVFLDSHCEANFGWLEPLLARIAVDSSIVVTPDIEVIDMRTFAYSKSKVSNNRGVFNWELTFKWRALPDYEIKRRHSKADPIRSPTMAGGLFAIDKNYFYKIGSYDTEMSYWGGENVEISFRIWMCGGSLEIIPCSKVGHVFRESQPYKIADGAIDVNNMRLAEVWMDDYKKIFYAMRPQLEGKQFGDVSERQALRKKLNCKSFDWYLKNIIPELEIPDLYPLGRGDIRNLGTGQCLDTLAKNDVGGEPGMYGCHGQGNNQFFMYTKKEELWHDDFCLDLTNKYSTVKLYNCHGERGNQQWKHTRDGPIKHAVHDVCLDVEGQTLVVRKCDGSRAQNWRFFSYPQEEKNKKNRAIM